MAHYSLSTMLRGVFLDTNVYIDWAHGRLLGLRRLLARNRIPVFLSPNTIFEGIEDFWTCKDHRLRRHRRALKLMFSHGGQRILPNEASAIKHALHRSNRVDKSHRHLRKWLRFALGLSSRQTRSGEYHFNKPQFLELVNAFRDSYVHLLSSTRDQFIARFAPAGSAHLTTSDAQKVKAALKSAEWEEIFFEKLFREQLNLGQPTANELRRCHRILAAALAFESALVESTIIDGYNPAKHKGDAFDAAHLKHLVTEGLTFITSDTRILKHVAACRQRTRVLNAADVTPGRLAVALSRSEH